MFKKKRKVLDFSRHFPKKILLESKDTHQKNQTEISVSI